MKLPGFTAEASLRRWSKSYRMTATGGSARAEGIVLAGYSSIDDLVEYCCPCKGNKPYPDVTGCVECPCHGKLDKGDK